MALYDQIVYPDLLVRRINLTAAHVRREDHAAAPSEMFQMDLFTDLEEKEREETALKLEKQRQRAVLQIQKKYGKNAILKGMNYLDGATTKDRNHQIGGHKA